MSLRSMVACAALAVACTRSQPQPQPAPMSPPPAQPAPMSPPPALSPDAALPPVVDAGPDATAGILALEVSAAPRTALLAAGDEAPAFRATTHDGAEVRVGGRRDRALVVYFYPRDETPGCTREACAFRDAFSAYREAGADIVGVSTDGPDAHRGFAARHNLPFGLIADRDGALAAAFGVPVAQGGYAARTTFVIGTDGRVKRVFPGVRVDGHSDEVLAAVRASR